VQKFNFQEKFRKNYEKSYFTRIPTEPEDRRERRPGGPSRTGGAAQAWPR
jgi:hypothetical protein